jgi:hypothetical protein
MRRDAEAQAPSPRGSLQFAHHIALRPHFRRILVAELRVIHREAIAVLRYRHDVTRTRANE